MNNLKKLMTALITPFKGAQVDWSSLEKLVEQQLQGGVEGFVINGTTAESPTLERAEVIEIFRRVRTQTKTRGIPLVMGTGSNATKQTIENTQQAAELGADAALVVVPYYNKPPQQGLFEHFRAVAEAATLPILLYNVPSRTSVSLSLETVVKLSQIKKIVGIKEASGDLALARSLRESCREDFVLLSGDDGTYEGFLKAGGDGVISVASHIIPQAFAAATRQATSLEPYKKLMDLLFIEANPIPVKKALQAMGVIDSAGLRLPLVEMSGDKWALLRAEMVAQGLLP